jgi:hypothetical protein
MEVVTLMIYPTIFQEMMKKIMKYLNRTSNRESNLSTEDIWAHYQDFRSVHLVTTRKLLTVRETP